MEITESNRIKIHDLAVNQITADFQFIKENAKLKGETLYGYAIGIVSDATGFFSKGNTIKSLKRILKKYEENDFHPSFFWWIPDWEYNGTDNTSLSKYLNETFQAAYFDWKKMDILRKEFEMILIKAIKTCDEIGIFGQEKVRNELIIYIQYADSCNEDFDDISSEKINQPELHNLFKDRWNSEKENLTEIIKRKIN